MDDDCYLGQSKRKIIKKINKYKDNFKDEEQNGGFGTLELLYKIQSKSEKLWQERTRPEIDADIPIIRYGSKQLEDLDASVQELRDQQQYLKQLEKKEKAKKEAITSKIRFQGTMKHDEGSGVAGMSDVSVRDLGESTGAFTGENCR